MLICNIMKLNRYSLIWDVVTVLGIRALGFGAHRAMADLDLASPSSVVLCTRSFASVLGAIATALVTTVSIPLLPFQRPLNC